MTGFMIGYFYLEESNPNVIASRKWEADNNRRQQQEPLLKNDVTTKIVPKSGSMRLITKTSYSIIFSYS